MNGNQPSIENDGIKMKMIILVWPVGECDNKSIIIRSPSENCVSILIWINHHRFNGFYYDVTWKNVPKTASYFHLFYEKKEEKKSIKRLKRTCGMFLTSYNHLTLMLQSLEMGRTRNISIKIDVMQKFSAWKLPRSHNKIYIYVVHTYIGWRTMKADYEIISTV